MRRAVLWSTIVAAAAVAGGALAAPLVLARGPLGNGNATVVPCDADGFTHSYATSRGNVTSVTVGGIADPACEGGTLRVTITSSSGASIASAGPQVVPTDAGTIDNSVTVSTSPGRRSGRRGAATRAMYASAVAGPSSTTSPAERSWRSRGEKAGRTRR
jgi:hypothetical protein